MASLDSHTQTGCTESDNVTAKKSFLKNSDLMALTISHLPVRNDCDKESSQCLLNVALTCKDFLEEALDALWKEMNSLMPLLKLLPALQVEGDTYVGATSMPVFYYMTYFLYRSLPGMCLRQIGIDCNITLEESSFLEPLLRMTQSPSLSFKFIPRHTFELLNTSHHLLLSFHLFVASPTIWTIQRPPISSFSYRLSLIRLDSSISKASKIPLLGHIWRPFPLLRSARSPYLTVGCQRTYLKNLLSTSSSSDL